MSTVGEPSDTVPVTEFSRAVNTAAANCPDPTDMAANTKAKRKNRKAMVMIFYALIQNELAGWGGTGTGDEGAPVACKWRSRRSKRRAAWLRANGTASTSVPYIGWRISQMLLRCAKAVRSSTR